MSNGLCVSDRAESRLACEQGLKTVGELLDILLLKGC
jgi:hypothetical protein